MSNLSVEQYMVLKDLGLSQANSNFRTIASLAISLPITPKRLRLILEGLEGMGFVESETSTPENSSEPLNLKANSDVVRWRITAAGQRALRK